MSNIDLSRFHRTFFDESAEGLDAMEAALLRLDVGQADAETINLIFRSAHSIKGGAGTFGWPGAFGTWWHADPKADAILMFLPQWRMPDLDPKAALASTSTLRLQLLHIQFAQAVYAAL